MAVDNIRLVQVEGDNLDFAITNPNTGDKLQYTIDKSNSSSIVSADLSESLSTDSPLVIFVEGKAFIDVENMAKVFDWQVKRTDNVVCIVTDPTIANGKAITIEECRIPVEEKAGEKTGEKTGEMLDELQQELDGAQKSEQQQQTASSQAGQSQASNPQTPPAPSMPVAPSQPASSKPITPPATSKPSASSKPSTSSKPSSGSSSMSQSSKPSSGSSSMSQSDRDKIEDVWGQLGETGHGDVKDPITVPR